MQFLKINISQGSVATPLRCGGICNDLFIANFLLSVTVKEFFKKVPNSLKYTAEYIAYFLGPPCRCKNVVLTLLLIKYAYFNIFYFANIFYLYGKHFLKFSQGICV